MIDDPLLPPVGVIMEPGRPDAATWRVWAPKAGRVELVLDPDSTATRIAMTPEDRGYHRAEAVGAQTGRRYAYSLDGGVLLPDPLSRWQPDGAHKPSAVCFPDRFNWDEGRWRGVPDRSSLVFYELHVGTFTLEGTFDAVISRLEAIRELGVTAVELMPVAQFPGVQGWGYDGVHPFAPQHSYGGPEALQRLVAACHRAGLAIFLDVVYNHFGPDGNYFPSFGHYFNERYRTDWGPAINYDGPHCDPVRAMILDNVRMWIRDYRFDGLRLDAADQIYDRSPSPMLSEAAEVARREAAALGRSVHLFAENDFNNAGRFLEPPGPAGAGRDLDGQWNDDFHHAVHVALTGDATGYYADFRPGPEAVAKVYRQVFVNDGCYSPFRDRRHGAPAVGYPGDRFVAFTQNHDQIANGNAGERYAKILPASTSRLAAGLLLLAPRLPLLFQGEEYGETAPFHYFCDFEGKELVEAVRKGRVEEFHYFGRTEEPPDPVAASTREQAVLSWNWEDDPGRSSLRRLYRDLLKLRRESPALRDFGHRPTRLHPPGDLLEAIRGPEHDVLCPEVRVLFNLSGDPRPFPEEFRSERPAFRSEVSAYGTEVSDRDQDQDVLRPHEFAIFGNLVPIQIA